METNLIKHKNVLFGFKLRISYDKNAKTFLVTVIMKIGITCGIAHIAENLETEDDFLNSSSSKILVLYYSGFSFELLPLNYCSFEQLFI